MAGTITLRDLVVELLASDEYFLNQGSGDNATWLDQVYKDLVNQPGAIADPNFATDVANLDSGATTRAGRRAPPSSATRPCGGRSASTS